MSDFIENAVRDELTTTVDGSAFYEKLRKNGQAICDLTSSVKEAIEKSDLSVSEAKGFLEYMKIVIDCCSYTRFQK